MANFKIKAFLDDDGNPIEAQAGEESQDEEDESQEDQSQEDQVEDQDEESTEDESEEGSEGDGSEDEGVSEEGDESEEEESDEEVDDSDSVEADEEEEDEETSEEDIDDEDVVDYAELPEAVQKFLDMYEETGGVATMEDFLFINQDFSKLPQDEVIRRALKSQNPGLDDEDIAFEMEERFGFDPDVDSDRDIRRKKVDKKKFYGQALKDLQAQKDKYGADLASRQSQLTPEAKEAMQFKEQFESQRAQEDKAYEQIRSSFVKATNKYLGKNFKGFEVKVGDQTLSYKPSNLRQVKEQNLDVNNFLSRFLDEKGAVKDVEGYHRALAFASDPDAVAEHFIELGKSLALEEDAKESKNIKKTPRKTQSAPKSRNTPKYRFVDDEDSKPKGKIRLKHY